MKTMRIAKCGFSVLCLLTSVACRSSEPAPEPPAPSAAPSEQHAHLAALVGEWNARMSM